MSNDDSIGSPNFARTGRGIRARNQYHGIVQNSPTALHRTKTADPAGIAPKPSPRAQTTKRLQALSETSLTSIRNGFVPLVDRTQEVAKFIFVSLSIFLI